MKENTNPAQQYAAIDAIYRDTETAEIKCYQVTFTDDPAQPFKDYKTFRNMAAAAEFVRTLAPVFVIYPNGNAENI